MYTIKDKNNIDNFSTYVTRRSTTFVNRELVIKLVPYANIKHVTKKFELISKGFF